MCREMISECAGALDQGTADMMTIVYADTQVQHVDTYMQGDIVKAGIHDGGGTAFRNSFEWLKKNAPDASCAIYLTDMETSDWGEEPNCPLLWAVYAPEHYYEQLVNRAPFGQAIQITSVYG
jgi:predicted metal-dependent peptidase